MGAGRKHGLALGATFVAAVVVAAVACATAGTDDASDGGSTTTDDGTTGGDVEISGDGGPCSCSPEPNVMTIACNAGNCAVGACNPGWYDPNGMYSDGCECQGTMNGTTCAMPTMVPPLMLGASTMLSGNLPAMMMENWFQLSFGGSNKDLTYHPRVTLSTNPNNQFVFDISSDCNGSTLTCGETSPEASVGLTDWEEMYSPTAGMGDAGAGDGGKLMPVPNVGSLYVRVYLATGKPPTCDNFVLTVSD